MQLSNSRLQIVDVDEGGVGSRVAHGVPLVAVVILHLERLRSCVRGADSYFLDFAVPVRRKSFNAQWLLSQEMSETYAFDR